MSELFRTGEWICRRGNSCREILDRLLLFGWLLSQRDPIELSCEGVMRQPGIAGLRPCRTSRSIASNRPLAIERANHGVVGNRRPSLKFNRKALRNVSSSIDLLVRSETTSLQILSCGKPNPAALSTVLRCSSVGSNFGMPPACFCSSPISFSIYAIDGAPAQADLGC